MNCFQIVFLTIFDTAKEIFCATLWGCELLSNCTTGAKVAGESWHTHILCSGNFMSFSTLEGKGRKHLLYALQGEPESGLSFVYNDITQKYLEHFKISTSHKKQLITHL